MPDLATDEDFMRVAIELAACGEGYVEPNPIVGCVLVKDQKIIGKGYHQKYGGHHAEVEALLSLASTDDAIGSTAYVTLEPCCHQGKTPPCTRALIDAGVARVVVAMQDPFAKVDGGGISALQAAGVEVEVGILNSEARLLTAPFSKRVRTGRPWVIAKWAMTMDGRIATSTGASQWISGEVSRAQVHQLRSRVDAIVVGMGTVIADDPMLNARLFEQTPARIAQRVVLCRHRLPAVQSRLIQTAREFPTLLVTTPEVDAAELAELQKHGVETLRLETSAPHEMIRPLLDHLGDNGATNVLVEGGGEVLSSFFSAGEVDETHIYIGPKTFGGRDAAGPVGGIGVNVVSDATLFDLIQLDRFDDDIRLIYRRK